MDHLSRLLRNEPGLFMLPIEVIYANSIKVRKMALEVPEGTTIAQAIAWSTIQADCPEINLAILRVGIFGELKPLNHCVEAGDRVEIYQPLSHDPMKSRKQKAVKAKKLKQEARQKGRRALHGQHDPLEKI